ESDKLWVRIITSKYLKETADGPVLWRKSRGSPLWRGIRSVWHEMSTACQHSIRNEKDTSFWTARLLYSDVRLAKHALVRLTDEELAMSVADAANEEAAAAINGETTVNLRHERTLHNIKELRHRNWETSVSHIFREGNIVADLLAHHGHSLNFGIHAVCIYPVE
ncbi:hypothetical protein LINPERPRIM_LOCUS27984, partial [Linum perenne]